MCPTTVSRLTDVAACRVALCAFLPYLFFFGVNGFVTATASVIRSSSRRRLRAVVDGPECGSLLAILGAEDIVIFIKEETRYLYPPNDSVFVPNVRIQ
ncbi:hypothetical protein EDB85DRAFT_2019255, partial [Lactarius pseudohatsudake]